MIVEWLSRIYNRHHSSPLFVPLITWNILSGWLWLTVVKTCLSFSSPNPPISTHQSGLLPLIRAPSAAAAISHRKIIEGDFNASGIGCSSPQNTFPCMSPVCDWVGGHYSSLVTRANWILVLIFTAALTVSNCSDTNAPRLFVSFHFRCLLSLVQFPLNHSKEHCGAIFPS